MLISTTYAILFINYILIKKKIGLLWEIQDTQMI